MLELKALKPGHLIANVEYVSVLKVRPDAISVKNLDTGIEFEISGKDLIESAISADQFNSTEKITKTELAQKLTEAYNRPFTVVFDKSDGQERVLRGRLLSSEPLMGRSHVEDLDVHDQNKLRLVDHRTLKSLIVDNVKYTLKK